MSELLTEGLYLMLFGMGFVFLFLTLLVFSTAFMSRLILKYGGEEPVPVSQAATGKTAAIAKQQQDEQLVAVISAAIKQYRSRHR